MNIVPLSTPHTKYNKSNYNKTRLRNVKNLYLPTLCQNAPTFLPELWHFSPQVQKPYDYVTNRTRKCTKNDFKLGIKSLSTCLLMGIEIVPPFCTTVQPEGDTISIPTGGHVDNLYCPPLFLICTCSTFPCRHVGSYHASLCTSSYFLYIYI